RQGRPDQGRGRTGFRTRTVALLHPIASLFRSTQDDASPSWTGGRAGLRSLFTHRVRDGSQPAGNALFSAGILFARRKGEELVEIRLTKRSRPPAADRTESCAAVSGKIRSGDKGLERQ